MARQNERQKNTLVQQEQKGKGVPNEENLQVQKESSIMTTSLLSCSLFSDGRSSDRKSCLPTRQTYKWRERVRE